MIVLSESLFKWLQILKKYLKNCMILDQRIRLTFCTKLKILWMLKGTDYSHEIFITP